MNNLHSLLALYALIVFVNTGLAVALWRKNRTDLYAALVMFWGSYAVALLVQGAAMANDLTIAVGFSVAFLSTLSLGRLFALVLDRTFPWKIYTVVHAACVVLTIGAFVAGASFTWVALPICVGICGPLIHMLVVFRGRWEEMSLAGKGLLITCAVYAVHALDFAFLRKVEWFAPIGFTIAVGIVFAQAILALAVVTETSEARARDTIAGKAEELGKKLLELRAAHAAAEEARGDAVRAREAAEQARDAKSAFLATMSHEIRTPLNGVLGMAELLATTPLRDDQTEFCKALTQSGQHLLTLIDDILSVSRLEAGRVDVETSQVDIRELLRDTGAMLAESSRKKSLSLNVTIGEEVPRTVWTDAARLRQILLNLVGNAVKFTHVGSVSISLHQVERQGDVASLRIEIVDTGIGISSAALPTIFEPFTQGDSSTSRRYGGTGLGLAICRRLAEVLGGKLTATSRIGEGSTFRLDLPLKVASASDPTRSADLAAASDSPVPLRRDPAAVGRQTVIVFDADPVVRAVARRVARDGVLVQFGEPDTILRADPHIADAVLLSVTGSNDPAIEAAKAVKGANGRPATVAIIATLSQAADLTLAGVTLLHKPLSRTALEAFLTPVLAARTARSEA